MLTHSRPRELQGLPKIHLGEILDLARHASTLYPPAVLKYSGLGLTLVGFVPRHVDIH